MPHRERSTALQTLASLEAANLTPGDPELAVAYALAMPDRDVLPIDANRSGVFLAIQTLRKAVDAGLSVDRISALHSAALKAARCWVEARSDLK